jgi:hypothetical protein
LELKGMLSAMRSSGMKALSWAAHRAGELASKRFRKAQLIRQNAEERERAAAAEKRKKKLPAEWWREPIAARNAELRKKRRTG